MSEMPVITVNTDLCTSCREIVVALQNAYFQLVAGKSRLKVRYDKRWVAYQPGSATQLLAIANAAYAQCDDVEGLPNLNPGHRTQRGAPFFLRIDR